MIFCAINSYQISGNNLNLYNNNYLDLNSLHFFQFTYNKIISSWNKTEHGYIMSDFFMCNFKRARTKTCLTLLPKPHLGPLKDAFSERTL